MLDSCSVSARQVGVPAWRGSPCVLSKVLVGFGPQAMAWAAFTGVGLAMVVPAAMSIIADYYRSEVRGRAFGVLFTVAALGERC